MFHSCRYRPCFVCFMFHFRGERPCSVFRVFRVSCSGARARSANFVKFSSPPAGRRVPTTQPVSLNSVSIETPDLRESRATVNHTRCMDSKTPHLPPLASAFLACWRALPSSRARRRLKSSAATEPEPQQRDGGDEADGEPYNPDDDDDWEDAVLAPLTEEERAEAWRSEAEQEYMDEQGGSRPARPARRSRTRPP